ncbi:MAG TPA: PQQ-dependent sugar dehydrogenase [Polyangiaceae bacterium]|nr:PQQ-dependent sugar dehydrogenase [Polyangiaceae bacterium]
MATCTRRTNLSLTPLLLLGLALATTNACSDEDDDGTVDGRGGSAGAGRGGSGGTTTGGGGGATTGGATTGGATTGGAAAGGAAAGTSGEEAGAGGTSGAGAAGGAEATAGQGGEGGTPGGGVDVDEFRPEEIEPTPQLVEQLELPAGFSVATFATGLGHARMLAVRGEYIYVTRPRQGDVIVLTDADEDGTAEPFRTATSDLPFVHGITFDADNVYLATDTRVYRAPVAANGLFGALVELTTSPLPSGGQHPYRTIEISPDDRLFISVGSSCNACEESDPEHATMLSMPLTGGERSVFARGLRNTIGFGWHPLTEELWGLDHGSDYRGNDLPPEELNLIDTTGTAHYGWPYCYAKRLVDVSPSIQDPEGTTKAEFCATTRPSTLEFQAHSAPIQMAFYAGEMFPAEYANDAFVALRGSWNRFPPTGYGVARLDFDEDGTPVALEPFVSGFLIDNGTAQFGRPAGVAVAPDGGLLFSDDTRGILYRVEYTAP